MPETPVHPATGVFLFARRKDEGRTARRARHDAKLGEPARAEREGQPSDPENLMQVILP